LGFVGLSWKEGSEESLPWSAWRAPDLRSLPASLATQNPIKSQHEKKQKEKDLGEFVGGQENLRKN